MQHDFPVVRPPEAEDAFVPKHRQGPRDRFNRHPEIIRNITTPHWKDHHVRLLEAAVYFQQKGGNFLQRFLTAQEKEVVFNVLKVFGDQVPDVVRDRDVTFGEPRKKSPALCEPDRGIDECIGRTSMSLAILDGQYIAR